jgi:hypothetical protein
MDPVRGAMQSKIPFRIRIGITGHRELPDEEKLSEKIRQALERDIFDLFDEESKKNINSAHRTPIAFSLLTPLAEGADRLVTKEVLKCPGSRIEVVLPLTKEDYLQDFKTQESRSEFEELLSQARRPITLKKQHLQDEFPGGDLAEARRQAYEDVGKYVVDHCDVLIALWDHKPSRGRGGTAEIIEYAREKKRPVIIISTIPPYEISVMQGHGLNARSISEIEMFNTFNIRKRDQQEYINNVYNNLFNNSEGERLPKEGKNFVREGINDS